MEAFVSTLPTLRDRVARDLRRDGLPRERVLACAVRLLDEASFRVGGETYAERNGSFGLATLRRSHVRLEQDRATFDYSAKSGTRRIQVVRDPQAASRMPTDREPMRRAARARRSPSAEGGGGNVVGATVPHADNSSLRACIQVPSSSSSGALMTSRARSNISPSSSSM